MTPVVLVAPDSFKGTMSAVEVADAMAAGVSDAGFRAIRCPLADGGEGTVVVLRAALGGELRWVSVRGSLGEPVEASYLLTGDGAVAAVDTATANGLTLIAPADRDAERASTYGTGQLLAAAVAAGARHVLLGVGGSATTDGGAGALKALTEAGGLRGARLTVLCDVDTAYEDAARVFAPQKGADAAAVERLTSQLVQLAGTLPRNPLGVPRTGCAGGLSGGLWAAFGAELVSGIDYVLDTVGFPALLAQSTVVLTGEGRLDEQSFQGKVVAGVVRAAARRGVPVRALVGRNDLDPARAHECGLAGVFEAGTPESLRATAAMLGRSQPSP